MFFKRLHSKRIWYVIFKSSNFRVIKKFLRNSAVMLEIYYEQMSYEVLTESESYLVNIIS